MEGEPLEDLEGALPAGGPDGLDDEGVVGGGHLDVAGVEDVRDGGGGGQGEDAVGEGSHALAPVLGALEGQLGELLGAGAAELGV